ncbi:hypothetical protein P152DRAFT_87164 [Eremomyces bilateralis CBS 781.70]|uniref:Uncharacterized protein n=1 Tax=Eremomyces bilateralis CBS 781.70 TaxID=1392243 RepID=A0A6G1FYN4_9PEZI|nr:uncharacterized protein P152DRAFT_87164 [Eremomyces bilateralis CBS 781.70]KAF1810893.1 hypothetical protein P152DRAFT_87164 [Eremomyces bilateralis CBS 781.70]
MSIPGAIFSSVNFTFKFVEFIIQLNEVASENLVFVKLVSGVRRDYEEARRLRALPVVKSHLDILPNRRDWIDATISDVENAIADIGRYTENARADRERDGAVDFKYRLQWVLSHREKFVTRETRLSTCHQSMLSALETMVQVESREMLGGAGAFDATPPPYEVVFQGDLNPRGHFARRKIMRKGESQNLIDLSDEKEDQASGDYTRVSQAVQTTERMFHQYSGPHPEVSSSASVVPSPLGGYLSPEYRASVSSRHSEAISDHPALSPCTSDLRPTSPPSTCSSSTFSPNHTNFSAPGSIPSQFSVVDSEGPQSYIGDKSVDSRRSHPHLSFSQEWDALYGAGDIFATNNSFKEVLQPTTPSGSFPEHRSQQSLEQNVSTSPAMLYPFAGTTSGRADTINPQIPEGTAPMAPLSAGLERRRRKKAMFDAAVADQEMF